MYCLMQALTEGLGLISYSHQLSQLGVRHRRAVQNVILVQLELVFVAGICFVALAEMT